MNSCLDDYVAQPEEPGGAPEAEERRDRVDGHEDEADDAVAAERGQHALEVGADDLGGNSTEKLSRNVLEHFF